VKYFKNFAELDCHNKIKPVPFVVTTVARWSQAQEQLYCILRYWQVTAFLMKLKLVPSVLNHTVLSSLPLEC